MRKLIATLTLTLAAIASPAIAGTSSPNWLTTPCEQEDGTNCYWDAGSQGNGTGHSFYAVKVGNKTCVLYWSNRYAKHHNYCVR